MNFFLDVQISCCTIHNKMRPAVRWSLYGLLACFQNMPTEVSGAKILILHPLYAGSHELVLRYTVGIQSKMAKQTFFKVRKSENSWAPSAIKNLHISEACKSANPQITRINPQISTKYCTILSQNSENTPKSISLNYLYNVLKLI